MFLHLGSHVTIWERKVIGIFSHKSTMPSDITQEFMQQAEKKRLTRKVNNEPPKSFILTDKAVFLSPIDSETLKGRIKACSLRLD